MGKQLLEKQDKESKGAESEDVDNYANKQEFSLTQKKPNRGVKLSIYHETKQD